MPNHLAKTSDEKNAPSPGLVNPRFVGVDELDRLLDAISVVTTHLEMQEAEGL